MVFKSAQFLPKSKAIGLLFYQKIMVFKTHHFLPKSKAIGLPFYQENIGLQNAPFFAKK